MRLMVMAELDTPTGNQLIQNGKIGDILQRVLGELKPECSYFYSRGGRRGVTLVVDVPDSSYIPTVAEPLWLELNASVEINPCMNLDELQAGLGRLH